MSGKGGFFGKVLLEKDRAEFKAIDRTFALIGVWCGYKRKTNFLAGVCPNQHWIDRSAAFSLQNPVRRIPVHWSPRLRRQAESFCSMTRWSALWIFVLLTIDCPASVEVPSWNVRKRVFNRRSQSSLAFCNLPIYTKVCSPINNMEGMQRRSR